MSEGTYSESWYRIREAHVSLRPHVRISRQRFRGEEGYVLKDPFGNQFFRLRPAVYAFVGRLSSHKTVQQVWEDCLRISPDEAPGQQEVIDLLAQLFFANLIQSDQAADSARLFERYRKRTRQEHQQKLLSIMFARIPLFDPDRLLLRTLPLVRPLLGPIGFALWILVLLLGGNALVENFGEFRIQAQGALAPTNLPLLYLCLIFLKTLHEFGHAFVCRRFGGEVHEMGLMLMVFTPIPYVNCTSAWAFRERWKRVWVGCAGVMVELFVAGLAALLWAATGPGTLHALAYNLILIASVSTLVFNVNPLLRFDGYYILSDLLDVPNLHGRSAQMWRYLVERHGFGVRPEVAVEFPARSWVGAFGLALFALLSFCYRIFVFGGILLMVGNRFLIVGVLMAAFCLAAWIFNPIVKVTRYLATSPALHRVRLRAVAVTLGLLLLVLGVLSGIPWPVSVYAPGVLKAEQATGVTSIAEGFFAQQLVPSGTQVEAGAALMRLQNPELEMELSRVEAQLREVDARLLQARETSPVQLRPLQAARQELQARSGEVRRQQEGLLVRARHAGIWTTPPVAELQGRWFPRGAMLGSLTDPSQFRFIALLQQQDAARLFAQTPRKTFVRLHGLSGRSLPVLAVELVPGETHLLPADVLGWAGGGSLATDNTDSSGLRTLDPFYELLLTLPVSTEVDFRHHSTGRVRFTFKAEPLLTQWTRKLRQLLQKRYRL
jgi:putative peptide zinc metalloprotease protein